MGSMFVGGTVILVGGGVSLKGVFAVLGRGMKQCGGEYLNEVI